MASLWLNFTAIFIVASGLLIAGFFLAWYPHSVIQGLEERLEKEVLTQPGRDWLESSLSWWQDEGVFAYGSASNFVILSGILVLIYAVVYSLLSIWRESIGAKPTDAKQYNIPQISPEGQETDSFQYDQTRRKARTGFPIAAGILTIIVSSIIMLFSGIFVVDGILTITSRYTSQGLNLLGDGLLGILVFAFALTAGIMTLKRKNFVFAILGMCFMVVKGATFIILTGSLLGVSFGIVVIAIAVISLIFTSISYKEFS